MNWREDEVEVKRRTQNAAAAIQKMKEGLAEFLVQNANPGDVEIVEDALVIFQSRGMDSNATYWRPGHLFLTQTGSPNGVIGLLATQVGLIEDEMSPSCTCGDD